MTLLFSNVSLVRKPSWLLCVGTSASQTLSVADITRQRSNEPSRMGPYARLEQQLGVTRDTDRLLGEGERTKRKATNGEERDLVLFACEYGASFVDARVLEKNQCSPSYS